MNGTECSHQNLQPCIPLLKLGLLVLYFEGLETGFIHRSV